MRFQGVDLSIDGVLTGKVVEVCLDGDELLINAIDSDVGQITVGFGPRQLLVHL